MLLLPSLMTEKSFWASEQRLPTKQWQHFLVEWETHDEAIIPVIRRRKRLRYRGRRSGCLLRIWRQVANLPLPSLLLANVQSLDNKVGNLQARISYQWDINNWNILCFTESWLNNDMNNIQLVGYTLYRQDETAASGMSMYICKQQLVSII
jgi:hypothetical protein